MVITRSSITKKIGDQQSELKGVSNLIQTMQAENKAAKDEFENEMLQKLSKEKADIEKKNKRMWEMSETVYKEKKQVDELNSQLQVDKQALQAERDKLEEEKDKIKEKNKKLWEQSVTLHKERERIAELKEDLEVKHTAVTDSIRYANRIQQAILPADKLVSKFLPNSFIYFAAKDIVSGDFYWMETVKYEEFEKNERDKLRVKGGEVSEFEKILFAAVDCTGHGVPGAFMSLVGYGGLSAAVNEHKLTKPADILNYLNISVNQTLQQEESQSKVKDGMDLAVCSLNLNERKLEYAGAFNPLYVVPKNWPGSEAEVKKQYSEHAEVFSDETPGFLIKADKNPVGAFVDEESSPFTNHEIQLQEGDCIYVFSDGYADQFGGPKGKKFYYKRFKELLVKVSQESMNEQLEILQDTMKNWMGDEEQIDDILVIGVRV
jgi:serine phosphatase RsbU (regulator of sigma subunit)